MSEQSGHHVNEFYRKLKLFHPTVQALSPYVDSRTSAMKFRCLVCTHEWFNKAGQVVAQRKTGCPKCKVKEVSEKSRATVRTKMVAKIKGILAQGDLEFVSAADTTGKYITRCTRCGRCREMYGTAIIGHTGVGCQPCSRSQVGLRGRIARIVDWSADTRFLSAVPANAEATEVELQCATCHGTWITTYNSLKKGSGCPSCGVRLMLSSPKRNPKRVRVSGKTFNVTGYEPSAIRYLVGECGVPARNISDKPQQFTYRFGGKLCTYTPDLEIADGAIVEVKSVFTFGGRGKVFGANVLARNKAKARAVLSSGYEFRMIIVEERKGRVPAVLELAHGWHLCSAPELRKFVVGYFQEVFRR